MIQSFVPPKSSKNKSRRQHEAPEDPQSPLDKAKQSSSGTSDSKLIILGPPTATVILRYRYPYGLNLDKASGVEKELSQGMSDALNPKDDSGLDILFGYGLYS